MAPRDARHARGAALAFEVVNEPRLPFRTSGLLEVLIMNTLIRGHVISARTCCRSTSIETLSPPCLKAQ
jgi:hypothetical protein